MKLCECGCGTEISKYTKQGELRRFVDVHHGARNKRYLRIISKETVLCACGCGIEIPRYDSQGRERFFAKYHRKHSDVTKLKISLANRNKPKSKQHRKALSVARKNSKLAQEVTQNNLLKMQQYWSSEEGKKQRSNTSKSLWNNRYDEMKDKSSFQKGHKSWNTGLTKETDERLKLLSMRTCGRIVSQEFREKSKQRWLSLSPEERMKRRPKNGGRGIGGFREDLGHYVRSRWEANFARFLNYMNIPYQYESKTFTLNSGDTYTPDFCVGRNNGISIFIELKGFMDKNSKRKIDFFKQEYPDDVLVVIEENKYKSLQRIYKKVVPDWE